MDLAGLNRVPIKALAAPFTVNTMLESTLKALANRKELGSILPADGGDCEEVLSRFAEAGINIDGAGCPAFRTRAHSRS
jgi:transaldolase